MWELYRSKFILWPVVGVDCILMMKLKFYDSKHRLYNILNVQTMILNKTYQQWMRLSHKVYGSQMENRATRFSMFEKGQQQ